MKLPLGLKKPAVLLVLGLLAVLLFMEAGFAIHRSGAGSGHDDWLSKKLSDSLTAVTEQFRSRADEAEDVADRLAAEIERRGLVTGTGDFERLALFRLLQETPQGAHVSGILVRDGLDRPTAWSGKTFDLEPDHPPRRTSGIHKSRMYRAIYAVSPVRIDGEPSGSVVVFVSFDSNFPLHNRYLRGEDFEEEVNREFDLQDIDISRREGAMRTGAEDPLRLGGPVRNRAGETIAHLNVKAFPLESRLARIDHQRETARGIALTALLLLLTVFVGRAALRERASLWWTPAFILVALVARSAVFQAGFPALLGPGVLTDPAQFSLVTEAFGLDLGWLHSPIDLLISGAVLLSITTVLLLGLHRRLGPRLLSRRRPLVGAMLAPLAVIGTGVAITLWLDLLHALTFYSTVEMFSEQAVIPKPPEAVMLLGLFFGTASMLLLVAAALLVPLRFLAGQVRTPVIVGVIAAVPLLLLSVLQLTDLSLALAALSAAMVAAGLAIFAAWGRIGIGLRYAALTLCVTLLTFPPLIREVWREVRADVEEEAEILFHPASSRSPTHLLDTDLAEISRDEKLVERLSRSPDQDRPGLAFQVWARGPLSRRPRGCDLRIVHRDGSRLLSHFEIDMPLRSWLPEPLLGASPDDQAVSPPLPGIGEGSRLRFLVGSAPVFSESGERVAQIVVRMPADRRSWGASQRPEILKPYETGADDTRRDLFLTVYDSDVLKSTTNPVYPRLYRADPEVRAAIFDAGLPKVWKRERVADAWWMNLYRPRYDDDRLVGMLSVGFRSREARSLLVSLLLLLLVNAGGALACSFVALVSHAGRFSLRFQHKLLLSYVVVSAIPVVLLARVNQSIAEDTVAEQMRNGLQRTAVQVQGEVSRRMVTALSAGDPMEIMGVLTNETMKEIGYRVGQEVNLFGVDEVGVGGAPLLASSEPGLYATELFSNRLPGDAYAETVIRGRDFHASRDTVGRYSYLVGYTPLRDDRGRILGVIGLPLIYGQDAVEEELSRRNSLLLALYILILLAVVSISMLLARRISAPIKRLAEATRKVSAGDLEYRIPGRSSDEFGFLFESFNRMTEDLRDSRERIVKAEKDAAWREMAKQIAHEIKNPLTPMRLSAQQVLRAYEDDHEDFRNILNQGLDTIIRQSETLSRIAGEFSAFARLPARKLIPVSAADLVQEVCELYRASREVTLVEEIGEVPPVLADPDELKRVIVNLAANAVQAMEPDGGTLRMGTGVMQAMLDGGCEHLVQIWVADTGTGIPKENLDRLFEPNFSTKTGGTGLGLAISRAVVDSLGGNITVESKPGEGSTFTVYLPPTEAPPGEE